MSISTHVNLCRYLLNDWLSHHQPLPLPKLQSPLPSPSRSLSFLDPKQHQLNHKHQILLDTQLTQSRSTISILRIMVNHWYMKIRWRKSSLLVDCLTMRANLHEGNWIKYYRDYWIRLWDSKRLYQHIISAMGSNTQALQQSSAKALTPKRPPDRVEVHLPISPITDFDPKLCSDFTMLCTRALPNKPEIPTNSANVCTRNVSLFVWQFQNSFALRCNLMKNVPMNWNHGSCNLKSQRDRKHWMM